MLCKAIAGATVKDAPFVVAGKKQFTSHLAFAYDYFLLIP